jgi:hypothetical protein
MEIKSELKVNATLVEKVLQASFEQGDYRDLEQLFAHLDQWCCIIEDELMQLGYWLEEDAE